MNEPKSSSVAINWLLVAYLTETPCPQAPDQMGVMAYFSGATPPLWLNMPFKTASARMHAAAGFYFRGIEPPREPE